MIRLQGATLKKGLVVCGAMLMVGSIGIVRYRTGPELALSLLYLPAIVFSAWKAGRWAGVLVSFCSAGSWLLADIRMLHTFSHAAIPFINETFRLIVFLILAFMTAKLKEMLDIQKNLARTDALTHIANRRSFYELAELDHKRARRHGYPLSVLYLDLDNFKAVNDGFGHQAGDMLLKDAAGILQQNIRAIDILGRIGGDEFCIVLVNATPADTARIAGKLETRLLDLMKRNRYPVAVSMGVAVFFDMPPSVADMIQAADKLMYQAKKEKGRSMVFRIFNKTCLAPDTLGKPGNDAPMPEVMHRS